jgi:23S rRNA (pseudouridine1915-N3)-methyltransferase
MKIKLLAVGEHMPAWVKQAYSEYVKRLPASLNLELQEIPLLKRSKNADLQRLMREESKQMLAHIAPTDKVIALTIDGYNYSSEELANEVKLWQTEGNTIALLIGGPEGLTTECLARANKRWSLSQLTFPHQLVKIIIAEQIYRAWTILQGHPYHR